MKTATAPQEAAAPAATPEGRKRWRPRSRRVRAWIVFAVPVITVLADAWAQVYLARPVSRDELTSLVLTPGGLESLVAGAPAAGWAHAALTVLLVVTTIGQVACMAAPAALWWVWRGSPRT